MISVKIEWKKLVPCLILPLAVGGIAAFLTRDGMRLFETVEKPPLSPPGWLFPVAWTILYLMMGAASYLVLVSEKSGRTALTVYGIQLLVNFFWPVFFFNLEQFFFAFLWLVLLWVLIWITLILFYRIQKPAGLLMIPYLLWVTFAGYLNLSIYLLN